jgi:deoxyguanosine kinase
LQLGVAPWYDASALRRIEFLPPNMTAQPLLIAIEGCVGVGKTTIARGLAGLRHSRLLLEDFSAVPFLEQFYPNPQQCALETEFSFLLQHYHQLHLAGRENGEVIADFALHKDLIFADLNMAGIPEHKVFNELYGLLINRVPKTALTVFVSASTELIFARIRSRGRAFELAAPPDYYRRLNAAYESFFKKYAGPIIRLSADQQDFCREPEHFQQLSADIDSILTSE